MSIAPPTTASLLSVTVPEMLPPVAANNDTVERKKAINAKIKRIVPTVEKGTLKRV